MLTKIETLQTSDRGELKALSTRFSTTEYFVVSKEVFDESNLPRIITQTPSKANAIAIFNSL